MSLLAHHMCTVPDGPILTPYPVSRKGVSFLSRIIGGKKREDSLDAPDDLSEMGENRPSGDNAEVFSQPIGFIPKFPAPPKYIKVKAQNRRTKSFDRVFLAQVLLGEKQRTKDKDKKPSDAQIVSIDEVTASPTTQNDIPQGKAIWAMEFSRDGKYLAAAGQDKKVRVWGVISTPEERDGEDRVSDNGSSSDPDEVKLNAPVFRTKLVREYDGHTSSVLDLSWSKNNFLLSSSMDKTVRLYHISRAECLCAFKHNDFVTSIQFHPKDDRFFLAGSLDSKLRLWSIPDKNVAYWAQVPDMVTAVAFTPDGKTALAGCLNGMCILYDTEGLKPHSQILVRSARGRNAKGSKITGIDTISIPRPDGQHDVKLLITSNDSRVRLYNMKDRNLEVKFRGNENSCSQIHATFSDDGKYVICGSEDRKVYIWPTGPVEKGDPEKRPVEVFEAHSAIVTTALLAPTRLRSLLAQSGDPVYDICNPPPVTLLGRSDSVISSRAPTEGTGNSDRGEHPFPRQSESPKRAPETPAYLARNAHQGGHIMVTADYTGQVKVFRHDCAYQKRRQESWESSSLFSKKMLGRSGSVTTRTSATSSLNTNRQSLNLGAPVKSPSADRILNWRNSVSGTAVSLNGGNGKSGSLSEVNLKQSVTERARSSSPRKSIAHRFSLRHGSTPLANENRRLSLSAASPPAATPSNPPDTLSPTPEIAVSSPTSPGAPPKPQAPDTALRESSDPVVHEPDDPLYLQGAQSFMYWNVQGNLGQMLDHIPRTPGQGMLGPESGGTSSKGGQRRNPLSRQGSVVSQLSSEIPSEERAGSEDAEREEMERSGSNSGHERVDSGKGLLEGSGAGRRRDSGGADLKCFNCGNETFRMSGDGAERALRCRKCGTAV